MALSCESPFALSLSFSLSLSLRDFSFSLSFPSLPLTPLHRPPPPLPHPRSIDFDTIGGAGAGSSDQKGAIPTVHDMQSRLSISPLPLDLGLLTSMANLDEKHKAGGKNGKAKKSKRSRSKKKASGGKGSKGAKGSSYSSLSTSGGGKKRARSPSIDAEARQAGLARGFAAFAKNTGVLGSSSSSSSSSSSKKRKIGKKDHEIPDDLFVFGDFSELTVEDALDDHRCAGIIRRLGGLKYTQQVSAQTSRFAIISDSDDKENGRAPSRAKDTLMELFLTALPLTHSTGDCAPV